MGSRPSDGATPPGFADLGLGGEDFGGTLRLATTGGRACHWRSAPVGVTVHALVIVGLSLGAIYTGDAPLPPRITPLALSFAPPPPAPRRLGNPSAPITAEAVQPTPAVRELRTPDLSALTGVPEAFLSAPALDAALSFGDADGFVDGEIGGMPEGAIGGVVGGVPGGVVGGEVGGTGEALPRFPRPDVGPSPLQMPQPSYTEEAIRNNVTGAVVLRVVIDEKGSVSVLEVLRSIPELDAEAIRVVESDWRFVPATRNGRPVPTLSDLRVRFQLH